MYFNENEKNNTNIDNDLGNGTNKIDLFKNKDLVFAILLGIVSLIILLVSLFS